MSSLRARILALIIGFGVITAIALTLTMYVAVRGYYVNVQYDIAREFAQRVAETHPDILDRLRENPGWVAERLNQYVFLSPKTGLYLLDDQGKVLSSAGEGKIFWSNYQVDIKAVMESLNRDPSIPIYSDDPDALGKGCIVAAHMISSKSGNAWVYVVARSADIDTAAPALLKSYAIRTSVKVALLTFAIGIALTLLMMNFLTRPLTELTKAAQSIQAGASSDSPDLPLVLPFTERTDELGKLSSAFRDLVSRLRLELARVTNGDAQRREMVASISHDVRTPLTALIAQLETIKLKGVSLNQDEQGKLFNRAIDNAHYLKQLTDALAELSHLDSPEVKASLELMPLGELADDVVQRFQPKADAAQVQLVLEYPEGLPLLPIDAQLLNRALSNLIDNALRYSPQGTVVAVAVVALANGVQRLSIKDAGPGIDVDDQIRVFERFYQASTSRSLRGSSGLGLAIVKRVVELHDGQVGVNSELGKGATFWIDLHHATPTLDVPLSG